MAYVPTNLAVSRDGNTYKASWKSTAAARRHWAKIRVMVYAVSTSGAETLLTTAKVNDTVTSYSYALNRANYAPDVASKKLSSIRFRVNGVTSSGKNHRSVAADFTFSKPDNTSSFSASFDHSTNKMSISLGCPDAKGKAERRRVWLKVTKVTNKTGNTVTTTPLNSSVYTSNDSGSVSRTITDGDWANLTTKGKYIKYTVVPTVEGIKDSVKRTAEVVLAWPDVPAITSHNVGGGFLRVAFKVHPSGSKLRPVSTVQLQYAYSDSDTAPADGWNDVSGADGAESTTALSAALQTFAPSQGQRVFVRIKATNILGESMASYSTARRIEQLEKKAVTGEAASNVVSIADVQPGTDGASINATVEWGGNTSYNATEISWSSDPNAWSSTQTPDSFQMPDDEWKETGANRAKVCVVGLDESTVYYVRARRYSTSDTSVRTGWSKQSDGVSTGGTAVGVTLSAPSVAAVGEPCKVSWTVGGSKPQTAWQIAVNGTVIADGEGNANAYTIPAELVTGNNIEVKALASIGGGFMESDSFAVTVMQRPTVSITAADVTATPYSFTLGCTAGAVVAVDVISNGITNQLPDSSEVQANGEVVYSTTATAGTVEIPRTARLIDGGEYTIVAKPYMDGLYGDEAQAVVAVNFAHQAVAPTLAITPDASSLSASVVITAPEGAADTDVCDLYRVTPNGNELCAYGVAFGSTVLDRFCAFGTMEYRACTRTIDGDRDWDDFTSQLDCSSIVLDFGASRVQLPYDPSVTVTPGKRYESVQYLDGSVAGHWSEGGTVSIAIGANTLKWTDAETQAMVQRLGEYPGSAYLRTPAGHAMECNAMVSSVAWTTAGAVPVALTCERLTLANYMAEVQ